MKRETGGAQKDANMMGIGGWSGRHKTMGTNPKEMRAIIGQRHPTTEVNGGRWVVAGLNFVTYKQTNR